MFEFIALDVQVHPDDQLAVEHADVDLPLKVVLEVHQFGQEGYVVRVGVRCQPQHLCHLVLHLVLYDLPLVLYPVLLLLVVILSGQGQHVSSDGHDVVDFFGNLIYKVVEVVDLHVVAALRRAASSPVIAEVVEDLDLLHDVVREPVQVLAPHLDPVLGLSVLLLETIY